MAVAATQSSISQMLPSKWIANDAPSVASVQGFKDAMGAPNIMGQAFSLDQNVPITEEKAMKAAMDMMEAFYSQSFKALFEEMDKNQEDNEFATHMTKDIFVEQLAKTMSRNVTSAHQKIVSTLMKEGQNLLKNEEDEDTQEISLAESFDAVSREVLDVRA